MNVNARPPARAATTARALPPLNSGQSTALSEAQGTLFGSGGRFLIEGPAGSGKSRLIVELARRWPGRVACCAPTHKAAAVLHEMLLADPTIDLAYGFTRGAQRREGVPPHRPEHAIGQSYDVFRVLSNGYPPEDWASVVEDELGIALSAAATRAIRASADRYCSRGAMSEADADAWDADIEAKIVDVLTAETFIAAKEVAFGAEEVIYALSDPTGYGEADETEDSARVAVGTIHALLGLQPLEDQHGKERLVQVADGTADRFSLIIIDEASMIGRALQDAVDAIGRGTPVLYVGDRGQLPPVGETEAPCFAEITARAELTEIVRQHRDNPILRTASALRAQQQMIQANAVDPTELINLPSWRNGQPGVFEASMDDIIAAFRADPERCRMLAYTNAKTIAHNRCIREAVIGQTPTPFIPGERYLVRSPVIALSKTGAQSILIPVNSEPEVIELRSDTIAIAVGGPLWKGRGKEWPARVLNAPVWKLVLRHEGQEIGCNIERKRGMRDDWLRTATQANRWEDRWRIKAALSDLRHLYSVTTHTAQGSTYGTVFIDARDLLLKGMAGRLTRLRLLYTAVTRPSVALGVYWEPQGFV